ncbi:DNA-(apurinic or apyrimidinic site) lyase [Ferroglobus placidus DSM 10642]|uniref:Endonuclease III n=1 Tax=Ferroglobus placidus (strain DSM 10642 / AEDII12DO) TaxID=589924 RepID=D3S0V9_FERPA|nr:endonuclease III [Ferroglobus placidus]ADC66350.1 DNA-(apurinic or apyrimidinic site) lyase [Ferroglobus placidus DSM 10642]
MDWEWLINVMENEAKKRNAAVFWKSERDPFKILVSAILSTRTRDEATIEASERLFRVVKTPEDLARMKVEEIEKLIRGVGFYREKAKKLKKLGEILVKEFNSRVPDKLEDLLKLPGVGRKVANVVLAEAFGKEAIAVDTHVHRISNRLGLVETKTPEETEEELKKIVPKKYWRRVNKAMVGFGQTICKPIKPKCNECKLVEICKYGKSLLKGG